MKTTWSKTMNLVMGILLLISVSYSAPSAPRQKTITQTEWIKTVKQENSTSKFASGFPGSSELFKTEYLYRVSEFNNSIKVSLRLDTLFQFTHIPARFMLARVSSNDDDYLLA